MTETEAERAPPSLKLRWYQYSLSSLLWIAVGIALLMTTIVQTTRMQMVDQQRRVAQRQVEELTKVLPPEIRPGWLSQVNAGPGTLFRGSLPPGDWRLAVYFWSGAGPLSVSKFAPPPGLAPLVAQRMPNSEDVEIRMSETDLPPGVTYNGKPVDIAFNIEIKDTRPGQGIGAIVRLPPLLLLGAAGPTCTITNASTTSEKHLLVEKGDPLRPGNRYVVLVERAGPGDRKPQIGTDELPPIVPDVLPDIRARQNARPAGSPSPTSAPH